MSNKFKLELVDEQDKNEFQADTDILCKEYNNLLEGFYPMHLNNNKNICEDLLESESNSLLNEMSFFKITQCMFEDTENIFEYLNNKMQTFLSTIYSLNLTICYGIVSYNGECNLIIGVENNKDKKTVKQIVEGLLSGAKLEDFNGEFHNESNREYGIISGVPSLFIKDKIQEFTLSPIMKSLNNENYTMLVIAKPIKNESLNLRINKAINIKDNCYSISKRNISRQHSLSKSKQEQTGHSESNSKSDLVNTKSKNLGLNLLIINGCKTKTKSYSNGENKNFHQSETKTENYSEAITDTISKSGSMAIEIQNSFALDLIKLAENSLERFKLGRNIGIWNTTITYSADTNLARNILQGCLYSQIAKANPDFLPPVIFEFDNETLPYDLKSNEILIPKGFFSTDLHMINPLISLINSQELSSICTFPKENVPGFEIRLGNEYSLSTGLYNNIDKFDVLSLGNVCDNERILNNTNFYISEQDLNKHTFICGITGSGKSNTVKYLLDKSKKPFLVIESAKKEYRNLKLSDESRRVNIYTLGKPELNCPQFNPFYILPGANVQMHIDLLKDLFNASFSFYGPMPYIIEKCLHNIYKKRGWNLTLGYHPKLVNTKSSIDLFDYEYINNEYKKVSHKYLFPTMNDLKDEVAKYIEYKLDYDGEISGNIKTAIMTRLESLCVGAKGYIYNTYEFLDFEKILNNNYVFELEGLADDSDKAFVSGLLVIFINEYRQLRKELIQDENLSLQHLLVIEEAHRLLKNINTEMFNEGIGNAKGKAVEHFTNMIAEMRSYGQGVIISEQIPSKIAPDIIKNSSNKIIHRIVSVDDQYIIANSIGLSEEKALYLGNQKTGFALCHKEGMTIPTMVKIGYKRDILTKDIDLYFSNLDKRKNTINKSLIYDSILPKVEEVGIKLLNTLLVNDISDILKSIFKAKDAIIKELRKNDCELLPNSDKYFIISQVISENIIKFLSYGVYSSNLIPDDKIQQKLQDVINKPFEEIVNELIKQLCVFYEVDNLRVMGIKIISELLMNYILTKNINTLEVKKLCDDYLYIYDEDFLKIVIRNINERRAF